MLVLRSTKAVRNVSRCLTFTHWPSSRSGSSSAGITKASELDPGTTSPQQSVSWHDRLSGLPALNERGGEAGPASPHLGQGQGSPAAFDTVTATKRELLRRAADRCE